MPIFMVQAAYNNDGWERLVHQPENRPEVLRPAVEALGGRLLSWYYCFGAYDVMVLVELPTNVSAGALSMAASAGKAVRMVHTTPLMTPEEGFDAMILAQGVNYRAPGWGSDQPD